MKKKICCITKEDKICLALAYFGAAFLTAWFIWSLNTYGIVGVRFWEFTGYVIKNIFQFIIP